MNIEEICKKALLFCANESDKKVVIVVPDVHELGNVYDNLFFLHKENPILGECKYTYFNETCCLLTNNSKIVCMLSSNHEKIRGLRANKIFFYKKEEMNNDDVDNILLSCLCIDNKILRKKMKTVEINLPYFKQGDDLRNALEYECGDNKKGLKTHANNLMCATEILLELFEIVDQSCEINTGTHYFSISGPNEIIDRIIDKELGQEFICEEDEDE